VAHASVLVVDDEELVRWSLEERLEQEGCDVLHAGSLAEARPRCEEGVDLVLLDRRLPDGDGLDLLSELRRDDPDLPVVLMTAFSSVKGAVAAMRGGAFHYVAKPFDLDEVVLVVQQALETTRLRRELRHLRARDGGSSIDSLVGKSESMLAVKDTLSKIATSPASTVLLTGESGTGKDLAARAIHHASDRAPRPFMVVTCSAVPESLLESEFFGHERGAFTDARQQRKGLFELADGGTVYLDEIGEMTPALQAKLLRFLEEKSFKRVGGARDVTVDVRVVAATNRDLPGEVREGRFREDLFYRLNVLPVRLPPLRERRGDLPLLVTHFLDAFNREFRKQVRGVAPRAFTRLEAHGWPGNVRELRNVLERGVLLGEGTVLEEADLPSLDRQRGGEKGLRLPPEGLQLAALERSFVVEALERSDGSPTRAALLLGMSRDQIRYRIEKYGLKAEASETDRES
jgi:two-component system, NtrC family, response regulator AtoC